MHGSDDVDPRGQTQHVEVLDEESPSASQRIASAAEIPQFEVGDVLGGQYELLDVLGSGGMGQVFAAKDHELNRNVAIKACWKGFGDDILIREAQVMAPFRHPGLIAVHALGRHEGVPYLVMERLYGQTLAEQLAQRRLPFTLAECLQILHGIADALAVLHRANLVHRDLKPENIMLVPPDRVVLLDFGIVQQERNVKASATVSGSPHYMAPEAATSQTIMGNAHLLDVYGLGVLAFRMVTDELPYDAPTFTEVLLKHVQDAVPDILALQPNLPPDLASIITEMLAKDPTDRPHSIEYVAHRLDRARSQWRGLDDLSEFSVLIVDDDDETRRMLKHTTERAVETARTRLATDGAVALQMFLDDPPHLMLLDLQMPTMNGLELCMSIANTEEARHTRIAIVSAHIGASDAAMFRELGITDLIPKGTGCFERVSKLVTRAAITASH